MPSKTIDPKDFPVFGKWSKEAYIPRRDEFLGLFKHLSAELCLDWDDGIEVNERCVIDIIDMVQRRRVYFHVYHNGMDMGELNEACLICFWLLKLNPFFDNKDSDYNVNFLYSADLRH
jgi:hypothetical protein